MKEKVSVVEIIVVIIIVAVLALVIVGAVINESNKISSDSFDVTPFEYNSYAVGDWYPKE